MNGRAYYNENDEFAAAWLRQLIAAGLIAPGDVDIRSIVDIRPSDLAGYSQCHFFAGIGVWSYALRCAGWSDDRAVWTGSCPCQPFSGAGKGAGFTDERHLWPAFFHLIAQCRPRTVLGEQVASPDGLAWVDLVQSDMEATDYAFASLDLCAAGFGAPHIRQRLFWVAHPTLQQPEQLARQRTGPDETSGGWPPGEPAGLGDSRILVDGERARLERLAGHGDSAAGWPLAARSAAAPGSADLLANAGHRQFQEPQRRPQARDGHGPDRANAPAGPVNGFWRNADWLFCRDGKWRPVEPGTFPLAHGIANRVGRLRGYGNALAAPVAQGFIETVMEAIP